eukprot:TRINITY_DN3202_c1_g2_i4.p2 TRINITY_DN3202_c1_g2~~TRINITY_DN3202_c1_g2_i4.p2  ORF type:complete len:228 (-),score=0.83 TRINITY_DN3202_c1_g2_i4:624-1307(-)
MLLILNTLIQQFSSSKTFFKKFSNLNLDEPPLKFSKRNPPKIFHQKHERKFLIVQLQRGDVQTCYDVPTYLPLNFCISIRYHIFFNPSQKNFYIILLIKCNNPTINTTTTTTTNNPTALYHQEKGRNIAVKGYLLEKNKLNLQPQPQRRKREKKKSSQIISAAQSNELLTKIEIRIKSKQSQQTKKQGILNINTQKISTIIRITYLKKTIETQKFAIANKYNHIRNI